ncbi:hypothetical protein ACWEV4_23115 [Streptomyces sp. NPDC003860]
MNGDLLAPGRPGKRAPAGGAAVVAHPNIALIKYWGKRDEQLFLPWTDSLSMPLDIFPTTTSVRLHATADQESAHPQQRARARGGAASHHCVPRPPTGARGTGAAGRRTQREHRGHRVAGAARRGRGRQRGARVHGPALNPFVACGLWATALGCPPSRAETAYRRARTPHSTAHCYR